MKLTYQAILDDPSLLERVVAEARRERSETVHRLIVAPIVAFFRSAFTSKPTGSSSVSSACPSS